MAGSVVVEQASVSVVPGEMGTCAVRIRNTGAVVDQFTLTVLGQPAAWTTVVPAALSLFPNADGTIELHFAPPRAPGVGAGPTPFGVRVVGSQDPDNPVVEEGEVDLRPFVDVTAKVTPRTSETKRKARHEIILDNKGNAPVAVHLSVSDPDEQLAFELKQPTVTVEAGQSTHVPLKVAAKKGFARGGDKHRPFQVVARPEGGTHPLNLDANLIQKAGLPRFVLPLVAGAIALALIAAVVPGMLGKSGGGGIIDLTNSESPTTTAEADGDAAGEDESAAATPEEAAAAAAAELAANGQDGTAAGGSGGGGGDTSAASGGGGSATGGSTGGGGSNTGGETTGVTSPSATTSPAPGSGGTSGTSGTTATTSAGTGGGTSATTTPTTSAGGGATTTAAPPPAAAPTFFGHWVQVKAPDSTVDIDASPTSKDGMEIVVINSGGKFGGTGSRSDASDGSFTSVINGTTRTFTLQSNGTMTMSTPSPFRGGSPTITTYVRG